MLISLNNSVIPTKVGIQVAGFIDSRLRGNDGRFRVFIGSVLDSNEIDGGQHYTTDGKSRDTKRDAALSSMGLSILRFSNLDELRNIDGVIVEIVRYLEVELGRRKTKSP